MEKTDIYVLLGNVTFLGQGTDFFTPLLTQACNKFLMIQHVIIWVYWILNCILDIVQELLAVERLVTQVIEFSIYMKMVMTNKVRKICYVHYWCIKVMHLFIYYCLTLEKKHQYVIYMFLNNSKYQEKKSNFRFRQLLQDQTQIYSDTNTVIQM